MPWRWPYYRKRKLPPYNPYGAACWHCGWQGESKEELWDHLDASHTY